jgi:hypothetical protein
MNIRKIEFGRCSLDSRIPTDDKPILTIDLPILFSEISTVCQGIAQVSANFINTDSCKFTNISKCKISSYTGNFSDNVLITSRPIILLSTNSTDDNPLVFSFRIAINLDEKAYDSKSISNAQHFVDNTPITLELAIQFKCFSTINLRAVISLDTQTNHLTVVSLSRIDSTTKSLVNTILLLTYLLYGITWAFFIENNIYQQNPDIAKLGTLIIGGFLMFIGISLVHIRNWTKTLAYISGLLNYPELHFPKSTYTLMNSYSGSVVIILFFCITLAIHIHEWVLDIPELTPNDIYLYDNLANQVIDTTIHSKIYYKSIKHPDQFKVYCSPIKETMTNINIGTISLANGFTRFFQLSYTEKQFKFAKHNSNYIPFKYSTIEHDLSQESNSIIQNVKNTLCGQESSFIKIEDDFVIYNKREDLNPSQLDNIHIKVKSQLFSQALELFNSQKIKHQSLIKTEYFNKITDIIPSQFKISGDVLTDHTIKILLSTTNSSSTISFDEFSNICYLRALWDVASTHQAVPNALHLESIATLLNNRINNIIYAKNHNQLIANFWKFIIEIENFYDKNCKPFFHNATIGLNKGNIWLESQKDNENHMANAPIARLFFCCINLNAFTGDSANVTARKIYFSKALNNIRSRLGTNIDGLKKYLLDYYLNTSSSSSYDAVFLNKSIDYILSY